jgi:hypothetical protein
MTSCGVKAFAFSYLGVVFAIYLNQLGYSTVTIGLLLSTASASGVVLWGALMQSFFLKCAIFLGGFLQLFHDCVFYFLFRDVKPPEEKVPRA